jgi:hypothetical protein
MTGLEVVRRLRHAVESAKGTGTQAVEVASLDVFTSELERAVESSPDNVANGATDQEKANWEFQRHSGMAMFNSVITAGQAALTSALLINGGAAAALLAFVGGIWSTPQSRGVVPSLAGALLFFVCGVLAAAVASGATYGSQALYYDPTKWRFRWAVACHSLSVVAVVASYVGFGLGARLAYFAFLTAPVVKAP